MTNYKDCILFDTYWPHQLAQMKVSYSKCYIILGMEAKNFKIDYPKLRGYNLEFSRTSNAIFMNRKRVKWEGIMFKNLVLTSLIYTWSIKLFKYTAFKIWK